MTTQEYIEHLKRVIKNHDALINHPYSQAELDEFVQEVWDNFGQEVIGWHSELFVRSFNDWLSIEV